MGFSKLGTQRLIEIEIFDEALLRLDVFKPKLDNVSGGQEISQKSKLSLQYFIVNSASIIRNLHWDFSQG